MNTLVSGIRLMRMNVLRFDRVWLALTLGLALLFLVQPVQGVASLKFIATTLLGVAPFLFVAIAIAAYAKATGADTLIAAVFTGRQGRMILFAALFGALSPFCSCGVIPIIASLLALGVPLPAIMAFWLSSPIMDPQMFLITASQLGLTFAVAKTLAAIGFGLMGGGVTWALIRAGGLKDPLKARPASGCGSSCSGPDLGRTVIEWRFWRSRERREVFRAEGLDTLAFLGKWLTLAFFLESLMLAYVPADAIARLVGGDSLLAIPLAVLVGVPAYLNGFAAIPMISGLMGLGMSPGAAMAFVTAGGVSCIPAAVAVFALVRLPVFALYLGLAAAGALLSGILFQGYLLL